MITVTYAQKIPLQNRRMSNENPSVSDSPRRNSTAGMTASELHAWLPEDIRLELAALERDAIVPSGTRLIAPDVAPTHLIILNSGAAEIFLQTAGGFVPLGLAGPGSVFDLRSIVCDEPPGVEIVCREKCALKLIPREEFNRLLKCRPAAYFAVARVLSSCLRTADSALRRLLMASTRGGKRGHHVCLRPAAPVIH